MSPAPPAGPGRELRDAHGAASPPASGGGFTLFEVLVVVAILALLAAVILPMVVSRLQEGDPVRLSSDLTDLRTGMELFRLDVRPTVVPGDLEDLSVPVDSLDADVSGRLYSATEQNRWAGPYIDFTFPEMGQAPADTVHLSTGFDARIHTDLIRYDVSESPALHATVVGADTIPVDAPPGQLQANRDWAAIAVAGLDSLDFERANDQVDGQAEADGSLPGESHWEGRLRYDVDLAMTFFLALPLKEP